MLSDELFADFELCLRRSGVTGIFSEAEDSFGVIWFCISVVTKNETNNTILPESRRLHILFEHSI
jgi:hypothetical protein